MLLDDLAKFKDEPIKFDEHPGHEDVITRWKALSPDLRIYTAADLLFWTGRFPSRVAVGAQYLIACICNCLHSATCSQCQHPFCSKNIS